MIRASLIEQSKRQLWMSMAIATLVAVVYYHFARFYQGSGVSWLFAIGWVPVGLNLLRAVLGLVYRLDKQPFRLLDLGLVTDQVAPGKALEIELRLETRRATSLKRMALELRCTRQNAADRDRKRTVLDRDERVLEETLPLDAGAQKSYRVSFPISSDAPYSFRSMEGKIAWTVLFSVDIDGWGEIRDELDVTVAPG